ncbi:unnamed protein product [Owenia fusiformis]|uniref:Uncharacterized protein n=1 Tax=Owenia fusiformis TaxID=6347 RepID=A0A8J1TRT6_OWEFU|nr:unnamed protein product [Owenia fusiformis]
MRITQKKLFAIMASLQQSKGTTAVLNLPKMQYYRKPLPDSCIAFSSPQGKKLFSEALLTGHMECYFKLAEQFRTQDEPAFCGLSTLVMVLNALSVDPGRVWKGPWRWYHENMLDCCIPIDVITQQGITLDQFSCLADCNTLTVKTVRLNTEMNTTNNLDSFREFVKSMTKVDDRFVVCSYSRPILHQTGSGHFSPIGGYHPGRDLVLILDTARFKYPPHWVKLDILWKAMGEIDKDTGKPRGYCILQKKEGVEPLMLFRPSTSLSVTLPSYDSLSTINQFITRLTNWFQSMPLANHSPSSDDVIEKSVRQVLIAADILEASHYLYTTQLEMCSVKMDSEYSSTINNIIDALENVTIFKCVRETLEVCDTVKSAKKIGRIYPRDYDEECANNNSELHHLISRITDAHFVTLFLLTWPYKYDKHCKSYGKILQDIVAHEMSTVVAVLRDEVEWLKVKIDTVLNYFENQCCNECSCKQERTITYN